MKKYCVICLFALIAFSGVSTAQDAGFGLGLIVGEPTGLCGKYWLSDRTAVTGAIAWSFDDESLYLHSDYIFHQFDLVKVEKGRLPFYYGLGVKVGSEGRRDEAKISARIPLGWDYFFENAPVDLFLEIVPNLDLVPETEFRVSGGLGARFFF